MPADGRGRSRRRSPVLVCAILTAVTTDNPDLRQRQPRQAQLIGHRRGLRRTDSCEPGEIGLRCVQYLAKDGVFDDRELKGFLCDLAAMRRADLGCARSVVDSDVTSLSINNAMPTAPWRELLAVLAGRPTGPAFWGLAV
jgi:hypothetical protein